MPCVTHEPTAWPAGEPCALDRDFKPLARDDRRQLGALLRAHPHPLSGYTFGCLWAWDFLFGYRWGYTAAGGVLVTCRFDPFPGRHLMQPIGPFGDRCAEDVLRAASTLDFPLRIVGVEKGFLQRHPRFVAAFDVLDDLPNANYIYSAEELSDLPGRKFAKKRNHIAQARHSYAWTEERLTPDNAGDALDVLSAIEAEDGPPEMESMRQDTQAVRNTLGNFGELEQHGILIRIDGRARAFSIYEPQTADTAVIHFERAVREHKGLYQVVVRAVSQAIRAEGFVFINREEDLGDPGLRQAKESYQPVRLEPAYQLLFRG